MVEQQVLKNDFPATPEKREEARWGYLDKLVSRWAWEELCGEDDDKATRMYDIAAELKVDLSLRAVSSLSASSTLR